MSDIRPEEGADLRHLASAAFALVSWLLSRKRGDKWIVLFNEMLFDHSDSTVDRRSLVHYRDPDRLREDIALGRAFRRAQEQQEQTAAAEKESA